MVWKVRNLSNAREKLPEKLCDLLVFGSVALGDLVLSQPKVDDIPAKGRWFSSQRSMIFHFHRWDMLDVSSQEGMPDASMEDLYISTITQLVTPKPPPEKKQISLFFGIETSISV